ncbi:MAG TPA: caspase family protein [Blastocatellia bacterium]|nr:caspase family protein [Blastocatellia bacterium]
MSEGFVEGYALMVGVGGDLPNTVTDAEGLANILKDGSRCGYPPDQVKLLKGENADRGKILSALDDLARSAPPDSTVVVYFSGHGYRVTSSTGVFYYLMPHGYDLAKLFLTAISDAEFTSRLQAIKAERLVVLLDCCHAGGLGDAKAPDLELVKSPLPPQARSMLSQGAGRILISSSMEDELSYAGRPYSAFTLALIEALSGVGVAKKDGYVRVADLALHAREVVPGRTGRKQHPVLEWGGGESNNFKLAYYAGGDSEPKGLPFKGEPEIEPEPGAWSNPANASVIFNNLNWKVGTSYQVAGDLTINNQQPGKRRRKARKAKPREGRTDTD